MVCFPPFLSSFTYHISLLKPLMIFQFLCVDLMKYGGVIMQMNIEARDIPTMVSHSKALRLKTVCILKGVSRKISCPNPLGLPLSQ